METLLRKYLWAVDLAVVALCATFLAFAAAGALDSKLAGSITPPRPVSVEPPKPESKPAFDKAPKAILKRNIFCSACPPILDEDAPKEAEEPSEVQVKTSLPLALLAIMYAPPPNGMRWSIAVMRDTEAKTTGAYPVGSKIHGATVTEILQTRVYLDNEGKTEYIDLFELPTPPAPPPPVAAAPREVDPFTAELQRGIKKLGEHKYELRRSTLESVLGNMALLSRSARIVPEVRDGRAAGFRLFAVRPEGPFSMIGMQNGDIISSINGLEITSPEKALEVYAKLKSASHLSLGMERNGQKITKDYNIR